MSVKLLKPVWIMKGGPGSGPRKGQRRGNHKIVLEAKTKHAAGDRDEMMSLIKKHLRDHGMGHLGVQIGDETLEVWDHSRDSAAPEFSINIATGRVS